MRVTGTMTSASRMLDRGVESKVSRAGEVVSCELKNDRGDVIHCSMSAEGELTATVDHNGRRAGAVLVTALGAVGVVNG